MKYEPLNVPCDLAIVPLQECAMRLGPAFVYTLTVNPAQVTWVRDLLREIASEARGNPFAPHINLVTDESLSRHEWFLSDGKRAVGSPSI